MQIYLRNKNILRVKCVCPKSVAQAKTQFLPPTPVLRPNESLHANKPALLFL